MFRTDATQMPYTHKPIATAHRGSACTFAGARRGRMYLACGTRSSCILSDFQSCVPSRVHVEKCRGGTAPPPASCIPYLVSNGDSVPPGVRGLQSAAQLHVQCGAMVITKETQPRPGPKPPRWHPGNRRAPFAGTPRPPATAHQLAPAWLSATRCVRGGWRGQAGFVMGQIGCRLQPGCRRGGRSAQRGVGRQTRKQHGSPGAPRNPCPWRT